MHGVVYAPDANGGPGTPKFELDGAMLNMSWQRVQNQASQAIFTLLRTHPLLDLIDWNRDHIGLWRESSAGVAQVFAGKIWKPQYGPRDCICWCNDYAAYLGKTLTGWQTAYANKYLGTEIIGPEIDLAIAQDTSVVAFLTKGTIEDPLGFDGITKLTTNALFGTAAQSRLVLFNAITAFAASNTTNNPVFEITRSAPFTFNFWKNKGVQNTGWASTFPGTLANFQGDVVAGDESNDLATILNDGDGGSGLYTVSNAASVANYRRLQEATSLSGLAGLVGNTIYTDQAIAAINRLLGERMRAVGMIAEMPHQGMIDPFIGWDLGDTHRSTYAKREYSGDQMDAYLRDVAITGAWTPNHGERLIIYRRTP